MTPTEQLAQGIAELGLPVSAGIQTQLADYLALIAKWNRVHNLTAVRESAKMVSVHALDSLAVVPHLKAGSVVDVGSGAGLPGIPLALMWPQARVVLLDSNHKKAVFLRQAAIELGLKNVEVVCERAESWRPAEKFDLVISRAFSDLPEFVKLAGHLCAAGGVLAAMKGVYPDEELAQLPSTFTVQDARPLKVPGLNAERHLILLNPVPS
ncbi:MAG: 16S rRNA (guanine(527)-N(7))-methyltransferase RsmG [Betaproteobacteria bacterium]|nr:16S rRNA (guanine(527)-N(7))-methyltransferase RsmG [Betaproteobacteria bacterium]